MPDYVEVHGPDTVVGRAAGILGEGSSLDADVTRIVGEIESIEGGEPWGTDKYGAAFRQGYYAAVAGGGRLSEAAKKTSRDLGAEAGTIGDAAMWAMTDYQSADGENAGGIASARDARG